MFDAEPEGWKSVKLAEIASIAMGETLLSKDMTGRGVPVFSANTDDAPWGYTDKNRKTLQRGAIVVGARGSIGFPRLPPFDAFTCTQTTISVEPDPSRVDSTFLVNALRAADIKGLSAQQAVPMLTIGMLAPLVVPLPPLDEQRRIAEVLRSVDDAQAAGERASIGAESILRAHLMRTFEGAADQEAGQPLESLLHRIIDYRGVPPPKADSGIPLITAKNVRFGFLDPEPREFIAEQDYEGWMRRGIPSGGDILFTTEAPLGFVAEFPSYKAALGQRTITLVADPERIDRSYLKWLLLSPPVQDLVHRHATGSTAKGIKQSTFRKLKVSVPALGTQQEIAATCESMWSVVADTRVAAAHLLVVKEQIAGDLLSGRVRVPA